MNDKYEYKTSMDEHEKAMRKAATVNPKHLMSYHADAFLALIQEQVKRMDEVCVWKEHDKGYTSKCNAGLLKDAAYMFLAPYAEVVHCHKCGKRIELETNEEKETNK